MHICLCLVFFQQKILCILDKMDNRMVPSVVHYEAHDKCVFLYPKSILYTMLCDAHSMGLHCCYITVDFKTFLQFLSSFYYCHTTHFMIMELELEPSLRSCLFSWQAAKSTAI